MPWSKRNAWIIALFTMIRGFLRRFHAVDTEWHVIWLNCQLSEENTENYVCANKINIIGQCFNLALDWTAVLFIIIITNNWQVVNVFNSHAPCWMKYSKHTKISIAIYLCTRHRYQNSSKYSILRQFLVEPLPPMDGQVAKHIPLLFHIFVIYQTNFVVSFIYCSCCFLLV